MWKRVLRAYGFYVGIKMQNDKKKSQMSINDDTYSSEAHIEYGMCAFIGYN